MLTLVVYGMDKWLPAKGAYFLFEALKRSQVRHGRRHTKLGDKGIHCHSSRLDGLRFDTDTAEPAQTLRQALLR
jgi:hypothetical protein